MSSRAIGYSAVHILFTSNTCYFAAGSSWRSTTPGKYVDSHCKIVASSPASYDEATAEKVWQISAELTGLEQESLSL